MGCVWLSGGRSRGPAHHQEGGGDGLLMPLNIVIGPVRVHDDNKGTIDGLRKGESKCFKPTAEDADLWIEIGEELHERGILVEVEHVKAHRTKKEKKHMSQFERFVTEGDEKADEMESKSNIGRRICGRSKSINCAAGKRGGVCSIALCGQLPLRGRTMEGQ